MKPLVHSLTAAAAISILLAGVQSDDTPLACEFCPDGIDDPDSILPTGDGATCGTVSAYAEALDAADLACSMAQLAEVICCPECSFCPDGLTVDPTTLLPTNDGATCQTAIDFAGTLEPGDVMCVTVQLAQALCCPPSPTTTEATTATTSTEGPGICSCSPVEYDFVLSLDQKCDVNDLVGKPGIDATLCLLSPPGLNISTVIFVQFMEFDASGLLTVINQDDTYSDVTLGDGETITFKSVSGDLDPDAPMEDQLNLLPGRVQVIIRGNATDQVTGEEITVINRVTWSYTNACDVEPVEEGMGIGLITFGELTPASQAFCPAAPPSPATTEAPPNTTSEAPPSPSTTKATTASKGSKSEGIFTKSAKTKTGKAFAKSGKHAKGEQAAAESAKAAKTGKAFGGKNMKGEAAATNQVAGLMEGESISMSFMILDLESMPASMPVGGGPVFGRRE